MSSNRSSPSWLSSSPRRWPGAIVGLGIVFAASTASAQVIGTFRWQFAPYCNVVTLRVEQKGDVYFGRTLLAPPARNIVGVGGAPTTNCPGTVATPKALPGQLCVYLAVRSNASVDTLNVTGLSGSDRCGASLYTLSVGVGQTHVSGRWAVTIP